MEPLQDRLAWIALQSVLGRHHGDLERPPARRSGSSLETIVGRGRWVCSGDIGRQLRF